MNAGSIVAIAVVLLLLAVGVFVVTARRHDSRRGQGGLSRETRKRDRSGRDDEEAEEPPAPTGQELEPVAVSEPGALEKSGPQGLVPYVPPDPETIGVTRRQFFNRSLVGLTVASLAGFGAAVVGFLWSSAEGRLRGQDLRGVARGRQHRDRPGQRLLLRARGSDLADLVPGRGAAAGRDRLPRGRAGRDAGRHQRPVPEVPAPRLPGTGVHQLAVVRVPVPRQPVQPGR